MLFTSQINRIACSWRRLALVVGAALAFGVAAPGSATAQGACPDGYGDITDDGLVNVTDVQCSILNVLWTISGMTGPQPVCVKTPMDVQDVNCDGSMSIPDVQLLISLVLGADLSVLLDANDDGCPDACEIESGCPGAMVIGCGDTVTGDTTGGSSLFAGYSCQTWNESGPEHFYKLSLPADDTVEVTIGGLALGVDLDIFLLNSGCAADACIASGNSNFSTGVPAGTYFIAVDGFLGDAGAYSLTVNCASQCNPATLCANQECGTVTCAGQVIDCGSCSGGDVCTGGFCVLADSCDGNCGGDAGNCFCDTSCFSFGDCCPDVCDFCAAEVGGDCLPNCGDGTCDPAANENCSSCAADCGCGAGQTCSGGVCQAEDCCVPGDAGCASNIACETCVCDLDPFCCDNSWDSICVGEAQDECQAECGCAPPPCGNGTCEAGIGEDCSTCAADCGCPAGELCNAGACVPDPCGDGTCNAVAGEDCSTCAADCGCPAGQVCQAGACANAQACELTGAMPIDCFETVQGDTTGLANNIDAYNCVTWDESGPEAVYTFTATFTGTLSWTFSDGANEDLDVFLLNPACDSASCVGFANASSSAEVEAGQTYYIVVDGFQGDAGAFTLSVACPLTDCGDGTCDAANGEDCDSCPGDCGCPAGETCNAGTCEPVQTCDMGAAPMPITCGESVQGDTTGGASSIDQYNCVSWNESGPEHVYAFTADTDGNVTVTLTNLSADLDVFILNPMCDAASCIGNGNTTATEAVTAGQTYYIVVDGFNGAAGTYTLSVTCDFDCGDGTCDAALGENCESCPADCGCPANEFCSAGVCMPPGDCCTATAGVPGCADQTCEDCVCALDPFCCDSAWDSICVGEATNECQAECSCAPDTCGDGTCDAAIGEDCASCAADCGCPVGESCNAGVCEPASTDCCVAGGVGCPSNLACEACVCDLDPFCCDTSWDTICAGSAFDDCPTECGCVDACGDGTCDAGAGETCSSCAVDCGCPSGQNCTAGVCVAVQNCPMDPVPMMIGCGDVITGDTTGATTAINGYNCQTWNESGPELVYMFIADGSGTVSAALSNLQGDLDLFVLAPMCDNASCIASGDNTSNFTAAEGSTYYIVVDGFNGANAAFTLSLSCDFDCGDGTCDAAGENCSTCPADCGCPAGQVCGGGVCIEPGDCCASHNSPGCNNALCEDCVCALDSFCCNTSWDGQCASEAQEDCPTECQCPIDPCGDGVCDAAGGENCSTCAGDCACAAGFACNTGMCVEQTCSDPIATLACNQPIQGSTANLQNLISSYNCVTWNESGPEAVYEFTAPVTGEIGYAVVPSVSPDLDVFVLAPGCGPTSCVDFTGGSGTFAAVAGETYYIVVDGFAGAAGDFTLTIDCPTPCNPATACDGLGCGTVDCDGVQVDCGLCSAGECVNNQCVLPDSCAGRCGDFDSSLTCQCDSSCFSFGDCCDDICTECAAQFAVQCACGDGTCGAGETCANCEADCGCASGQVCSAGVCQAAPSCTATSALDCSSGAVNGNTTGAASTINQYACISWNEQGPEVAYSFTAQSNSTITAALSNLAGKDLDVFILESACSPTACLASGNNSASITTTAGTTYYIVVDGFAGAAGAYTLTLTCGP